MAEREADRARPDSLHQQAVAALCHVGREISPDFRRRLRERDAAPGFFDASELAAVARSGLEVEVARNIGLGGTLTIQREARLIDPAEPLVAESRLRRLLKQHQSEWNAFMGSLPEGSWVREIVVQL